jgi:hypothetical protein
MFRTRATGDTPDASRCLRGGAIKAQRLGSGAVQTRTKQQRVGRRFQLYAEIATCGGNLTRAPARKVIELSAVSKPLSDLEETLGWL